MFEPNLLEAYSEQSYIVKFWGYLFEEFFGDKNHVYLQWGDTQSKSCQDAGMGFRLDLRIVASTCSQNFDILLNGGFAKMTATNENKYYYDKCKAVLAAKNHLNHIITNTKYLPPKEIHTVYMPVFQIMEMSCHLYVLSLIDKGLYLLQRVCTMSYPVSNREIQTGALQRIVRGFALIEDVLQNVLDIFDEYNKDTQDIIMKKVIKKKGPQQAAHNQTMTMTKKATKTKNTTDKYIARQQPYLKKTEKCVFDEVTSLDDAVFAGTDNGIIKTTKTTFFDL